MGEFQEKLLIKIVSIRHIWYLRARKVNLVREIQK